MTESIKPVDQEILHLFNTGNQEKALKLFINQYQTKLYSLAYRMLGNHDDAMDALQEILLQVHRSLRNFKGQSSLYTWVYRLSSNVCLNFRNKRSRTSNQIEWDENVQTAMLPVERPNEDPDKMCESKYNQFLIQQAIMKLPETQRVLLVLHDLEGISIPEVASILNINLNAAKSRLHRGRTALRKIISKGFVVKGMEGVGVFSVGDSGRLM
ncbi:RNA polymerase sigma factor [Sporomusa sp.]|uniref:RNA polymerase sigma factor n=1 Tax=Sporomusa sp. TaxID=2078658 RepID=UPI002C8E8A85|nr:RNA polymerase sigma factor [Sporomusa sp.]HWR42137.1 RNA polymerase sigma factor [Sporomusa sp.]